MLKVTIKHPQTEMGLVLHYLTFFCLSPPSSLLLFLIFLLSLLIHIWIQHVSPNVLPCWFFVSGKLTAWLFNSLLIPGDQTKKLRDVFRVTARNFVREGPTLTSDFKL